MALDALFPPKSGLVLRRRFKKDVLCVGRFSTAGRTAQHALHSLSLTSRLLCEVAQPVLCCELCLRTILIGRVKDSLINGDVMK